MKSTLRAPTVALTTAAFTAALLLTSCDAEPEAQEEALGGGPVSNSGQIRASAPEPTGKQLSHDRLRSALEEQFDGAEITDTDTYWADQRDLNRELQKLAVSPTDCKSFVITSALPVPSGSLTAVARSENRQRAVYSFEDTEAAQSYVQNEQEGLAECREYRVTRELNDEQIEASTTLRPLEIRSGAETSLALQRRVESDGDSERSVGVLLSHGSLVAVAVETFEEDPDEAEMDQTVVELEAEAAAVLSQLTGEEIIAPEPEPEPEPEEDSDETGGAEEGGSEDSTSAEDSAEENDDAADPDNAADPDSSEQTTDETGGEESGDA
ncbi:hypothetical protein [Nesterenkonia massiliensis]|uniref:hypothetical protein n=1 Tax=Nesterenkonia massiliensis TaxID=1232429 RepID=UPI0004205050|nr:hypothetical protein [Nesterenkonia massiliensis]